MTVIPFPGGRNLPPKPAVDALIAELTAVEIELRRAQLAQLRSETRQAQALWGWWCFKRCLIWGCVVWLLVTFAKADPLARSRTFYNERGSFAGSSVTRGNSSSFYDGRGSFDGSAIRHGKWTIFYDQQGRYSGTIIDPDRGDDQLAIRDIFWTVKCADFTILLIFPVFLPSSGRQ